MRVVDGAVVAFGKHLDEPAIDCGAFLLSPEVFDRQRQVASEGDHTQAGAVTRLAQTRPLRAVTLPAGCWWQDVDAPQDARAAKMALRRSLGKDADGPVSRWLNRLKGAQMRSCSSAVLIEESAEQVASTHGAPVILGAAGRPGQRIWWSQPECPVGRWRL